MAAAENDRVETEAAARVRCKADDGVPVPPGAAPGVGGGNMGGAPANRIACRHTQRINDMTIGGWP
jgi:hypothetical protein